MSLNQTLTRGLTPVPQLGVMVSPDGGPMGQQLGVPFVSVAGSNELRLNASAAWANSAGANTVKNLDVDRPVGCTAKHVLMVTNPSASDLKVVVQNRWVDATGATHYTELTNFTVTAGQEKLAVVEGWLAGDGGRLALSNVSAIGAAGAFASYVQVRGL